MEVAKKKGGGSPLYCILSCVKFSTKGGESMKKVMALIIAVAFMAMVSGMAFAKPGSPHRPPSPKPHPIEKPDRPHGGHRR